MCYTSGTTGNPKGVALLPPLDLAPHHGGDAAPRPSGVVETDTVLPVVPMFHANAWGLAHAAVAAGADLVMPGPDLSPPALVAPDRVASGSPSPPGCPPSGWGCSTPSTATTCTSLRAIPCGGSAVPRSLSEAYRAKIGCRSCRRGA